MANPAMVKNADNWSKQKLEQLLVNLIIDVPEVGNIVIEAVEKCCGKARVNILNSKLSLFYEWEIVVKCKWYGLVEGNEITEKIEITFDESTINIDIENESSQGQMLYEMMEKGKGTKKIAEKIEIYCDALKTEFSQNITLEGNQEVKKPISNATVKHRKSEDQPQIPEKDVNSQKRRYNGKCCVVVNCSNSEGLDDVKFFKVHRKNKDQTELWITKIRRIKPGSLHILVTWISDVELN